MAKTIQRALGLPFIAAIMAAAPENPSLVKKIAGDWLVEEGKRLGSGRPGRQSENEVAGLREAIKHNPTRGEARMIPVCYARIILARTV